MKKIAVVLFNLGGPDKQEAVQPFLFNLFHDPAIIGVPQPLRFLIAKLISLRRAPVARAIYAQMSGGSPILPNTQAQAEALQTALNQNSADIEYKTFITMRYWHPMAKETVQQVCEYKPDEILLVPLYPQFSTTTTASSFKDWHRTARKAGLDAPTRELGCYPTQSGFIAAVAAATRQAYIQAAAHGKPRILFSAHGLPEKIIKAGDPYAAQCAMTVDAVQKELAIDGLDSVLCFQSRVGPLKWIGPSTDEEVKRSGHDRVPLVVVPIAFVSDHSETLVEINIEYRHLAAENGVPFFAFVPTVGADKVFIDGLAQMVRARLTQNGKCVSHTGTVLCPPEFTACACRMKEKG